MMMNRNATEPQQIAVCLRVQDRAVRFTINLYADRFSHQNILRCFASGQLYENEVSTFLLHALRPGDCFVDVGAHVGYFSLLAASLVGPAGRVFSFEPEPGNFADLLRNKYENSFANLVAFPSPVSAATGDVVFHLNADNDGGHALWEVGRHPFNTRSRARPGSSIMRAVALQDVATICDRLPRVLKIDTEGAEARVLEGAANWLAGAAVPFVVAEINEFGLRQMNSSQADLRAWMWRGGYRTYLLHRDGKPPVLVPRDSIITCSNDDVFNVLFAQPASLESLHW